MMVANICWQCGDIGLSEALVYCLKCQIVRRHSYCLEVIPEDLSGEINWLCEDCRVQARNSASKARPPQALSVDTHSHGYGKTNIGLMDPCQDIIVSVTDFLISHQDQHPTATVRTDSGFNNDSSHVKRETSSRNTDTSGVQRSSACLGMNEDEIGGHVKEKPNRRKWRSPDEDELDSFHPRDKVEGISKSRFPKTVSPRTDDHGSGRTKMGLKDSSYPVSCPVNDNLPTQDQHPAASVRISSSLNTESYVSNDLLRETSRCNTGAFGAVGSSTCLGLKDDDLAENVKETLKRRKLCLPNQDELENLHPLVGRQDASYLMGHVRHKAGQPGILNSQIMIPCQVKSLPMPLHFWSGCFIISNKRFGPFKAHLSVMACKKVCDAASQLPLDLHMQKLPRLDAWPNSFKTSPPMENNIALFVFPLCDRVETVLDELVDDIINNDLMLRLQFDEVELLIFSSIVLPREHQRISGKYYPWGVFKPRIVQECSAPEGSQINANVVEKGVQVANPNRIEKGIQVGGDFEDPANSWDKGIEDDYGNGETLGPSKESEVEDHDNVLLEDATQVANGMTLQGPLIPPGKERGRATSNCSKESKWSVISVADCLAACDEEKLQAHLDIGGLSENCTLGPKEAAEEREVRIHTVISSKRLKVFRELEEGEIWEDDDEYAADLQSGVCQSELNQPDKVWQNYEEKQQMADLGISSEGQKASSELEIGEICNDEFSDDVSKQHAEDALSFQDVIHPLKVSLDDLYNGTSKKLSLSRNVLCSKCKGKGFKSGASMKCSGCRGSGMKAAIRQLGPGKIQQMRHPCNECKGTGVTINDKDRCPQCKGEKFVQEKKVLDVIVEKGMQNGQKITFPGEADEAPDRVTGDIVFVLQQNDHSMFKRKGEDLFVDHTLSLTEALCGFQFMLTQLDGRQLLIKSNPGEVVKPDQFKAINDEGMPMYQKTFMRGKLYIHFTVDFPDSLTTDQCKAIEAILPPRSKSQLTDMELDDRQETAMQDVNIQEEMRKQQAKAEEAYKLGGAQRVHRAQQLGSCPAITHLLPLPCLGSLNMKDSGMGDL